MRLAACLDSTISTLWRQLKGCAPRAAGHYLSPSQNCGCSSVVERLVANEKVASSTLVTRSPAFPLAFPLYCRYMADYSFSKRDSDYVTIGTVFTRGALLRI